MWCILQKDEGTGACLETSFPHPHQRIVTSGSIWKQSSKLRNSKHFRDHLQNHTGGQGATTVVTGDFAHFSTSFLSSWHSPESPDSLNWGISQIWLACGPVYEGFTLVVYVSRRVQAIVVDIISRKEALDKIKKTSEAWTSEHLSEGGRTQSSQQLFSMVAASGSCPRSCPDFP